MVLAQIGEKAGLEYVNSQLQDKANVNEIVSTTTFEQAMLGKVGTLEYQTDSEGFVQRLDLAESNIQQTKESLTFTVTNAQLEAIEIGANKCSEKFII